jgi:hypothetical protein
MQWDKTRPILLATYDLIDQHGKTAGSAVCEAMGVAQDDEDIRIAIEQLDEAGYVKCFFSGAGTAQLIDPTALGLQYCSGWPTPGGASDFLTAFLSAVAERADATDTPEEEKSRLRRFIEAANGAPKELLAEITTKLIEGQAGR